MLPCKSYLKITRFYWDLFMYVLKIFKLRKYYCLWKPKLLKCIFYFEQTPLITWNSNFWSLHINLFEWIFKNNAVFLLTPFFDVYLSNIKQISLWKILTAIGERPTLLGFVIFFSGHICSGNLESKSVSYSMIIFWNLEVSQWS